jgi:hypothetical protein
VSSSGDRLGGGAEGQSGKNDEAQSLAPDVHAFPKTIGAKKNGPSSLSKPIEKFGSTETLLALNKHLKALSEQSGSEAIKAPPHLAPRGKQHQSATVAGAHQSIDGLIGGLLKVDTSILSGIGLLG